MASSTNSQERNADDSKIAAWVPPLMCNLEFDYEAGATVILTVREYPNNAQRTYKGVVFRNPVETGIGNSITLISMVDQSNGELFGGHHTFFQDEIISVTKFRDPVRKVQKPVELTLETHIVSTADGLRNTISILKSEKEIGIYIPWIQNEHAETTSSVVVLNVRNVIVSIPTNLLPEKEFWGLLSKYIFANESIQKIFFEIDSTISVLKRMGVPIMQNKLELKMLETCLQKRKQLCSSCKTTLISRPTERTLIDLVKAYLPQHAIASDRNYMDLVYSLEPSVYEPKHLAIQVKYLLFLKKEMLKTLFQKFHSNTEVKIRSVIANPKVHVKNQKK